MPSENHPACRYPAHPPPVICSHVLLNVNKYIFKARSRVLCAVKYATVRVALDSVQPNPTIQASVTKD